MLYEEGTFVEEGTVIDPTQYRCAHCGKVYNRVNNAEWNDEKADAEHDTNFPGWPKETAVTVCDDCYKWLEKRAADRVPWN